MVSISQLHTPHVLRKLQLQVGMQTFHEVSMYNVYYT